MFIFKNKKKKSQNNHKIEILSVAILLSEKFDYQLCNIKEHLLNNIHENKDIQKEKKINVCAQQEQKVFLIKNNESLQIKTLAYVKFAAIDSLQNNIRPFIEEKQVSMMSMVNELQRSSHA